MKGDFTRSTFNAEKHYRGLLIEQGRVQLDADWNELQEILRHDLDTKARDVIGLCGTSIANNGFLVSLSADGKALQIGKGRLYVNGILCENEADIPYLSQADLPNPPDPLKVLQSQTAAGVVYIDVWARHITALDDPLIREVALNGADTATRVKTLWQVKVLPVAVPSAGLNCGSHLPEWDALTAGSTGRMNARSQPTLSTDNPCLIPPTAGYQSLENHLYRVEIHKSGAENAATFKWSRDNGSVETGVIGINGKDVTVRGFGPDEVLGFASGQTVELLTDHHDLFGLPGQLLTIDSINAGTGVVTLKTAPDPTDISLQLHPRMRRWDSSGELALTPGAWVSLESGVQVQFAAGTYATGDYWLIPARSATGEIEWPPFAIPNSNPVAQSPAGIRHAYARLAILQMNPTTTLQDCRSVFPSLGDVPSPDGGIHIKGLLTVDPRTQQFSPLVNDTNVQVNAFGGVDIQCDADVDKASVSRPTCYLSIEDPVQLVDSGPAAGYRILKLAGNVSTSPSTISWRPTADCTTLLATISQGIPPGDRGILTRLTLKGNFIWAQLNRNLFLDGEAFGDFHDGATNIFLKFPSGDKRRGGDFEMWFWLVAAPATLSAIQLPNQLVTGAIATVTIALTDNAPAGGVPVAITITSTPANLLTTVPPGQNSIVVPAGSSIATFTVQVAANLAGQATVTASVPGMSKAATVSIAPLSLTGTLSIAPQLIIIGSQATGTVNLTAPAPSAPPTVVTLVSSNAAVATVPVNVTVPSGSTSAQFFIKGVAAGSATVTATLGVSLANAITVRQKTKEAGVKEVAVKESAIKEAATKEAFGAEKVTDVVTRFGLTQPIGPIVTGPSPIVDPTSPNARAFIRPEERPEVGQIPPNQ
jgi:hypothetical protein